MALLINVLSRLCKDHRRSEIPKVIKEWAEDCPLVEDVRKGKTTFEKEIKPLVDENLKIKGFRNTACTSETFKKMGVKVAKKFSDIVELNGVGGAGRRGYEYSLADCPGNTNWITTLMALLAGFSAFTLFAFFACMRHQNPDDQYVWCIPAIGGIVMTLIFTFQTKENLSERKQIAQKALNDAKTLDKIFAEAKA